MTRVLLTCSALALLCACQAEEAPTPVETAVAETETCGTIAATQIDRESFRLSEVEIDEDLLAQGKRNFDQAAKELCAEGSVQKDFLNGMKQLVFSHGEGADTAAFFTYPESSADIGNEEPSYPPDYLIFQHWWNGRETPDVADIKEGLICFVDYQANEEMCAQRAP